MFNDETFGKGRGFTLEKINDSDLNDFAHKRCDPKQSRGEFDFGGGNSEFGRDDLSDLNSRIGSYR